METDYQRAWRERGEAERALRLWRANQSNIRFDQSIAIFTGLVGALMIGYVIEEISRGHWEAFPVTFLGLMFMSMLFIAPAAWRQQKENRDKARETLVRLGVWNKEDSNA